MTCRSPICRRQCHRSLNGGATGEAFVISGVNGGEDLLLLAFHGAEVVFPVENGDTTESTQGDSIAGLAKTETGLMNGIHQVRIVDDYDFTPRRLTSHGCGGHLELAEIHTVLPIVRIGPSQRRGL